MYKQDLAESKRRCLKNYKTQPNQTQYSIKESDKF